MMAPKFDGEGSSYNDMADEEAKCKDKVVDMLSEVNLLQVTCLSVLILVWPGMFLETSLLFNYTLKELGSVMYMDYEQLLQSKGMKMILVNYFT